MNRIDMEMNEKNEMKFGNEVFELRKRFFSVDQLTPVSHRVQLQSLRLKFGKGRFDTGVRFGKWLRRG